MARGFFATCKAVITSPRAFFADPPGERSAIGPLGFATLAATLGAVSDALVDGFMQGNVGRVFGPVLATAIFTPIGVYVAAAIAHGWLVVLRGAKAPFRETVAAVAYGVAPAVLGLVPIVGGIVGGLVRLGVTVVALGIVHGSGRVRATVAVVGGPLSLVALMLAVRAFGVEAFKIPSGGMRPTLAVGDHVFANKLTYRLGPPARGDVAIFRFPENRAQDFVQRVVGLPGETVEFLDGRPIVDGVLAPHCHVGTTTTQERPAELFVEFLQGRAYLTQYDRKPEERPCTMEGDCSEGQSCRAGICGVLQGPYSTNNTYWVVGDNRNNSHDSRSWRGGLGAGVERDDFKGRAGLVWMSFLPGGAIANDRLFVDVSSNPVLSPKEPAALHHALETCLAKGP